MKAAHAKNRLAHDLISSPSVLQERHLALRFMRATVLAQLPQYVIESLICPTEQVKFGKRVSSRSGHAPLHGVVFRIFDPVRHGSQRPADSGHHLWRTGFSGIGFAGPVRLRSRCAQATPDTLPVSVIRGCATRSPDGEAWWAHKGSNLGPLPCEPQSVDLTWPNPAIVKM